MIFLLGFAIYYITGYVIIFKIATKEQDEICLYEIPLFTIVALVWPIILLSEFFEGKWNRVVWKKKK